MMKSIRRLLSFLLACLFLCHATTADNEADKGGADNQPGTPDTLPPPRVFTPQELKLANGVDSENLYLCILGKVYDVSAGAEYYGAEGPYHVFVGRDAPVPFVTGIFTEEESAKPWDALEVKQHGSLSSWIDFYENEEKYPFIGVVQGTFYDEHGNPLPELARVHQAMEAAKEEMKRREEERKRKLAERKKQREQQMMTSNKQGKSEEL